MRILQVSNLYYPELKFGGPAQKIHDLSRSFVQRGHEVRVVTFHSEKPRARGQEIMDGVRVEYLPWVGRGLRQVPLTLRPLVEAVREAEIVHCNGLYDLLCPAAAWQARRARRPYVLEPLGMFVPRAHNVRFKKIYHRCFTFRMARSAAAIIAASPAERDTLVPLAEPERLVVRRNGIDVARFRQLPAGRGFRERWKIPVEAKLVLYIGRISPIKNLEQLILAFEQAGLPGTMLLLVGPMLDEAYAARLRGVLKERALEQRVRMTGPLYGDDKLGALAAADLFVLPSISESFGNAAAEAVAAGIPVLLTEGCGIAPMIHGRAGLAVPLGTESLAEGLRRLAAKEQRVLLTSRRIEVLRELSWDEPVRQTEELYRRIVGEMRSAEMNDQ